MKKKKERLFDVLSIGRSLSERFFANIENSKGVVLSGVYIFKVSLSKGVWRKIKLSGKHTLGDLHLAIQEAFEFDNDHLYAFYFEGDSRKGKPIYCEYAQEGGSVAEKTVIEKLRLYKGQKIVYLFDFGDEWEFNVEFVEIDEGEQLPLKPIIVEAKGKPPEQYGSGW